jgi:cysteine desulfurase
MWGTKRIYLDWAAAAPVSSRAEGVFMEALRAFGNPGAVHTEATRAKALLEDARTRIARLAEVKASGVVFTSGATESNALAILGSVRKAGVAGAHVLYHPAQHASVVGAMQQLKKEGASIEEIDLKNISKQIRENTVLISIDAVGSETGEHFDTLSIRRAVDATNSKVLLHVDAAQAPFAIPYTLAALGADMVSLDAQKVGGVRGIGALLIRSDVELDPLMHGGGQERGMRPGTENPALAAAFATALTEADEGREKFIERSKTMRLKLIEKLRAIPKTEINEGEENVLHIVNVSVIGRDTDYLVALLDTDGFAVSTRSACESDSAEGSRAVRALTGDDARATSTLRISWGPTTKESDLDRFSAALASRIRFLDEKAI